LFAELYLDEDVDVLLAELVAFRGFSVETTIQAGMLGATDVEQLEYAARRDRVLLTHNRRDFERLAEQWRGQGKQHSGILLAHRRPTRELA
jgi:predicted nuclease of predicted toxin-antitoxin system